MDIDFVTVVVIKNAKLVYKSFIKSAPSVFSPAFGNFIRLTLLHWSESTYALNATGQTAGGVNLDSDGVTIHVTQAGSYYIDYYVSVNYNPDTPGGDRDLGLFING